MRPDLFAVGYRRFAVAEQDAAVLFSCLQEARISPKNVKRYEKNGDICFSCTLTAARRLTDLPIPMRLVEEGGLPILWRRLLRRPGLLCGMLLALLLTVLSSLVVWDIEILGNEQLSTAALEEQLEALGVRRGTRLSRIDEDALALALRQADPRISYAAVNRKGTVLQLQIREAVVPREEAVHPANLVAKSDCVITMPLIFEGECLVEAGQVVRAGQLLASGIVESEKHGFRVTRAAGQVLARTTHTYTVRVPFTETVQLATGDEKRDVSLFFFDFSGKVFKSTGNHYDNCDIIENIKWVTLPSGQRLPFGIGVTVYRPLVAQTVTRDAATARALALSRLSELLAADSADRTMLEKHLETVVDAEGITLFCTVVCEEDVALTVEFESEDPFS
ncbi:MAG: hypothetical protein E7590_03195 [Ruminococcaceae bacterium]|nr:hypothetical protein [Oscillospiraceae bacterium]